MYYPKKVEIVEEKQRYKRKENKISHLSPEVWLGQTNLQPQGLHITVASHQSQRFIHWAMPQAFSLTNPSHSFLSCTFLLACQKFKVIHRLNPSLPTKRLPKHSSTYNLLAILSFPVLSIWPKHQWTLFVNPFPSVIPRISNLRIRQSIHSLNTQQTSEVVHLHNPNPRSLLFSPYQCLSPIQQKQHEERLIQYPSTFLYIYLFN